MLKMNIVAKQVVVTLSNRTTTSWGRTTFDDHGSPNGYRTSLPRPRPAKTSRHRDPYHTMEDSAGGRKEAAADKRSMTSSSHLHGAEATDRPVEDASGLANAPAGGVTMATGDQTRRVTDHAHGSDEDHHPLIVRLLTDHAHLPRCRSHSHLRRRRRLS